MKNNTYMIATIKENEKYYSSMISRLIKETMDRGLIKLENEKAGDKSKRYLPFWA